MTVGGSLALIAAGAILRWAVTARTSAVNIQTVGLILFIVGLVGLAVSLFYALVWVDRGRGPDDPYVPPRPPRR